MQSNKDLVHTFLSRACPASLDILLVKPDQAAKNDRNLELFEQRGSIVVGILDGGPHRKLSDGDDHAAVCTKLCEIILKSELPLPFGPSVGLPPTELHGCERIYIVTLLSRRICDILGGIHPT
jgi:hypothetical protein